MTPGEVLDVWLANVQLMLQDYAAIAVGVVAAISIAFAAMEYLRNYIRAL